MIPSFVVRMIVSVGLGISTLSAQWPAVPTMDFSQIQLSQFADHELEVPYHLKHFAQVANAVVETPFTDGTGTYLPRGFLNLKVSREPADNKPYNARIMEMQAALAYFYTADRPWNPYRGSAAVRMRLEAMLQRWSEMQAPPGHSYAGLFTEYSSTNWGLAPTGFGVRHAAESLDLILDSGLTLDATILENARISLRRALMAMFTRSDMRNAAKQYSNQFSGSYHAALIYLENWSDAELNQAFIAAFTDAASQDQSPAGFWYEAGGPDFGYSNVHDSNMRIALPRLRNRSDLMPIAVNDDIHWNQWLAANLVPQPGLASRTFLINAGLETRTSDSVKILSSRPYSEFVEVSRIFSLSDTEYAASLITRRSQVQSQFGNWGALAVPNSSSYLPSFVHDAVTPLNAWHPTTAQREAAGSQLACLSQVSLNRQFRDSRPTVFTMAKRPQYYAAVTTGNIRVSRQVYGLGLLWNPSFGVALQSVAGNLSSNTWLYGTRRVGSSNTYETADIPSTITAGGAAVAQVNGVTTLPMGDLRLSYALAESGINYGQKTITLGESQVGVSITHSGSFTELLPLACADDAVLSNSGTRLTLARPNGSSFVIEITSPGAVVSAGGSSGFTSGLVRRPVTITANGSLDYRLIVTDANPSAPEFISPAWASTPPGIPVEIDLRNFVSDLQTPDSQLYFSTGTATGGSVELLENGFTARFSPAANYVGISSFDFRARDQGRDPRLIRHYSFESPDVSADGVSTDASGQSTNGELSTVGSGSATYQDDAPPCFPVGESGSLQLVESGAADFARLRTTVPIGTHDLSNGDWTAAFWFKRTAGNTHDFLFYLGSGNGFGGDGHELEIFAPANSNTLRMQYWDGANSKQADLTSAANVNLGQWNHAAVVWEASGIAGQGTLYLYLNGQPFGSAAFTAAFKQTWPLVFGGIQSTAADPRNFNGSMDDVAFYADALDASEVASLSRMPVANHAGLESSGSIGILLDSFAANLDAHWTFENDWVDLSGRAWELSPSIGATLSTARSKQGSASLSVPTNGDFASSTIPIPLGNAFTLASWVYLPTGENSIRTIAANSGSGYNANGFRFFVNRFNAANAELVLETGNGVQSTIIVSPAGTIRTDCWQHVAAVVDRASGNAILYLNGHPVASGAVRTDFNNNSALAVGAMETGIHCLRGNIDDFRIYSQLLSSSEIETIFAAANDPPHITAPSSFTIAAGTTSSQSVGLADEESWAENLDLTAISSDPGILPLENIVITGSGATRSLTIRPVAWKAGVVTVTLKASDGVATSEAVFQVTVTNSGQSALWTATTTGAALAWSIAGNWAQGIPPYPGADCDLDFLSGTVLPAGLIVSTQDLAIPFVARSLKLGGSGVAAFQIVGPSISLVTNGANTPSMTLDATGPISYAVDTPIQIAGNCLVGGNGDALFDVRAPIGGAGGIVKTGTSSIILSGSNDFTGFVSVQSGAVRIRHDSALGSGGVGTTVQGGNALATLEVAGGITSSEPIQLAMHNTSGHTQLLNGSGNNTLSGQLTLNAGGARWDISSTAGSIHFAGPVLNIANPATPDTWRKLYLGGAGGGSFSNSMSDAVKSKLNVAVNSGTWYLTGSPKSYTGTTEVIGGKLSVETQLQSKVMVSAGATFRGQGGSTSAMLDLQPDAVVELSLASWNAPPAAFTSSSFQFARVTVRIDSSLLTNFSETERIFPLLRSTSAIGQPDLSQLTIVTVGFPGQGRWSVQILPSSDTLSLRYQPDLYQTWISATDWHGEDSSDHADPDGDGVVNFLEYALGGEPTNASPSILPAVTYANGRLAMGFTRVADPALLYEILASDGLAEMSWQTIWSSTGTANTGGPVLVEDTPPVPAPRRRFLRLRVGFATPGTPGG